MEFDLELAKQESNENPVYYVQYAHARIAQILKHAESRGMGDFSSGNTGLLTHLAELALVRKMIELPELVEIAAAMRAPHQLPHYAIELATAFHQFYTVCQVVVDEEPDRSRARLKLVSAAKVVLKNTLGLIGVSAPERMEKLA